MPRAADEDAVKRVTRDGKLLSHALHGRMPIRELHLGKFVNAVVDRLKDRLARLRLEHHLRRAADHPHLLHDIHHPDAIPRIRLDEVKSPRHHPGLRGKGALPDMPRRLAADDAGRAERVGNHLSTFSVHGVSNCKFRLKFSCHV